MDIKSTAAGIGAALTIAASAALLTSTNDSPNAISTVVPVTQESTESPPVDSPSGVTLYYGSTKTTILPAATTKPIPLEVKKPVDNIVPEANSPTQTNAPQAIVEDYRPAAPIVEDAPEPVQPKVFTPDNPVLPPNKAPDVIREGESNIDRSVEPKIINKPKKEIVTENKEKAKAHAAAPIVTENKEKAKAGSAAPIVTEKKKEVIETYTPIKRLKKVKRQAKPQPKKHLYDRYSSYKPWAVEQRDRVWKRRKYYNGGLSSPFGGETAFNPFFK